MTFKVLVYADIDTQLRHEYVISALKRDLAREINGQGTELLIADRHNIANIIQRKKPNIIIVPENRGPISYHTRDLSSDAINAINKVVYDGGKAIYFGGMSHHAASYIEWYWAHGQVKYKGAGETFCQVSGRVTGPHITPDMNFDAKIAHQGCFEVALNVPKDNGQFVVENCWQGNCATFEIKEQHDVLAYYHEIDARHVAAAEVPKGNNGGSFILCSVMPHYNHRGKSALWDSILTRIENKKVVSAMPSMLKRNP